MWTLYLQHSTQTFAVSVNVLCNNSIVVGKGDGSFGSYDNVRRDEFSQIVYKAYGVAKHVPASPPCQFSDVPSGSQFYEAISSICQVGIVTGYTPGPNGTFGPANFILRPELAAFIFRATPFHYAYNPAIADYTDVPHGSWAYIYIETLYLYNVIAGAGGSYHHADYAIRGDVCSFVDLAVQAVSPAHGRLGQALSYINAPNAQGVNTYKTVPFNGELKHWSAGPVGLTTFSDNTNTFLESGPSFNLAADGLAHNYSTYTINGGMAQGGADTAHSVQIGHNYDYWVHPTGGTSFTASACDDGGCRDLEVNINLNMSTLPFVASGGENTTPPAGFGITNITNAVYLEANGAYAWCWNTVFNTAGANVDNCTQGPRYNNNWVVHWSH